MQLAPGTAVDRYVVHHVLGRGAQAVVYAVEHRLLGSRHALKVLTSPTEAQRALLVGEGRAQALLDPTCVVPVTDLFEVGESLGLLMPLVDGCSLRDVIAHGPLPAGEVAHVVAGVSRGLHEAHRHGIVHLDLKPANVMLDRPGHLRVRVTDFGVAATARSHDKASRRTLAGSPAYMSPEQVQRRPLTPASDLWSLGVMIVQLLTGSRPFRGDTLPALFEAVQHGPIDLSKVPDPWRPLVRTLLERDPTLRQGAARAVLSQLPLATAPTVTVRRVDHHRATRTAPPAPPVARGAPPQGPTNRAPAVFGRDDAVAELSAAIEAGPAVIVVHGPGGVGKTMLVRSLYGVLTTGGRPPHWCDLDDATSLDEVRAAVASVLGRASSPLWIVLDGVDLVGGLPDWLAARRREAPHVGWVVTRRRAMQADVTRRLGPLSPDLAAQLLTQRLREAAPDEPFDPDTVARLAVALDGLPRALELAAARGSMLSPQQMLDRWSHRLRLLVDRRRPGRHGSLTRCIDRSYEALDEDAQRLLRELTVFRGVFTDDDVAGISQVPRARELLNELVARGLVQPHALGVRLLGSHRHYARQRVSTEADRATVRHHGRWFAQLGSVEACDADERSGTYEAAGHAVRARQELAAALERLDDDAPAELRAALARAHWLACRRTGPFEPARSQLARALDGPLSPPSRATLLGCHLEALLRAPGPPPAPDALRALTEELLPQLPHPHAAVALARVARLLANLSFDEAHGLLSVCEDALAREGHEVGRVRVLALRRTIEAEQGLLERREHTGDVEAELTEWRRPLYERRAWPALLDVLSAHARILQRQGRVSETRHLLLQALGIASRAGDPFAELRCLLELSRAILFVSRDDLRPYLERAAHLTEVLGAHPANTELMSTLHAIRHETVDTIDRRLRALVADGPPMVQASWLSVLAQVRFEHHQLEAADAAATQGLALATGSVPELQCGLVRAQVAVARGEAARAKQLLGPLRQRAAHASPMLQLAFDAELACLHLDRGDHREAQALIPPLHPRPDTPPRALEAAARLAMAAGPPDPETAQRLAQRLRAACDQLMVGPRTRERLDQLAAELGAPPPAAPAWVDDAATVDFF